VWLSRGFERITGYSRAGAAGRNCRFLQVRLRVRLRVRVRARARARVKG